MSEYITFLIQLLQEDDQSGHLVPFCLKVKTEKLKRDCKEHPMEPDNRNQLEELLPRHVRSIGPIVEVEEIFDAEIID